MTQGLKGKIFEKIAGSPYQTGVLIALADLKIENSELEKEVSSFTKEMEVMGSHLDRFNTGLQHQRELSRRIFDAILEEYLSGREKPNDPNSIN
jgi:hypothetical protein